MVNRSVTLSRKPIQPNRDGGSGRYPRVRRRKYWRFGGKGGCTSTGSSLGTCLVGTLQVVGRGFGGNGGMATVTVERSREGERQARFVGNDGNRNRVDRWKPVVLAAGGGSRSVVGGFGGKRGGRKRVARSERVGLEGSRGGCQANGAIAAAYGWVCRSRVYRGRN